MVICFKGQTFGRFEEMIVQCAPYTAPVLFDAHFKDNRDWPYGFQGPLPRVWTDSLERPFPVSSGYLFLGLKVSEIGEAEKCPHPREPLSGTPTAQIGGWEMIVLRVSYTAPLFVWRTL